jgi:ABC-2 type transport system ATP-binding protein
MISVVQARSRTEVEAPSGDAAALLSVSHLTKSYGSRPAVRDVSFDVGPGVTGILGPNGAGKSTLMRCLAGLSGWDSGDVHIAGVDLARRTAEARRKIGFMPERVAFPLEMRVWRYLRFVAEMKGIPARQRAAAVDAVLAQAGLEGSRSRIVGNLSKGYRQRVGLAQALLGEPAVLILDEPSAGLDPLNVMEFRAVIRHCARDRAVLVSTHLLSEAPSLCDRVVVMSAGLVVFAGPTAEMTGAEPTTEAVEDAFRRAVLGPGSPVVDR